MRKLFVAANWKMFTNSATAQILAGAVAQRFKSESRVLVAVCPPFPYLSLVAGILRGNSVALGAQNLYPENEGPFTGEVSAPMLKDVGCRYVIVGHSERRHVLGEDNSFINRKVLAGLAGGLEVIFCLGETLNERENDKTEVILESQLSLGLTGMKKTDLNRLILAYEPVWAIGTGRNATPDQAQSAHAFLRRRLSELFGNDAGQSVVIQYGGSVKPENAAALLAQPDVDGALIGGASLKPDQFVSIVEAAVATSSC